MTSKPCEGCGEGGGRPVGKLCAACTRKLKKADELVAAEQARGDLKEYKRDPHGYGYYYSHPDAARNYTGTSGPGRQVQEAWRDLLLAMETPPVSDNYFDHMKAERLMQGVGRRSDNETKVIRLPEAVALELRRLDKALHLLIVQTYGEGFRDGTAMLRRLATGNLTVDELNKVTAPAYAEPEPPQVQEAKGADTNGK
jgi:hypothetical protein